jgi:phosphoribosylamine--glycine ligase
MRVLLVGHGGREHALAWRITQSRSLETLVVTGDNPGWPLGVVLRQAATVKEWVSVAISETIDLVVVGPEAPLSQGLADELAAVGIPCFGPQRAAALLESSKGFAKDVMAAAGVETAAFLYAIRNDEQSVLAARTRCDAGHVVIKVDGLAAGKGVFVCETAVEAHAALDEVWSGRFGSAADTILLEDRLTGPEVSLFALCDGSRTVALPSSQDHKTLLEGNRGPNTGGMGAYVPCPLVNAEQGRQLVAQIHQAVVDEMRRRGCPFVGVLYAGLMMTPQGPRVLEFNVRFGDPECQPIMQLWEGDILPWLHGAATGSMPDGAPTFAPGAACCVVLASAGYPLSATKGTPIPDGRSPDGVEVFLAGTRRDEDGVLRTAGGRVLGVSATAETLALAQERAYSTLPSWAFDGCQYRRDIASQAIGS